MPEPTEEQLADLIATLRPAPAAWVEAAIELGPGRAAIDGLVALAASDEEARAAMLANLEDALRGAGVEPSVTLLESLRSRLGGSPE